MNSSLGISSHLGWAAVTADNGDRGALEPYHVAGGFDGLQRVDPPADPAAAVAEGLQRQRQTTLDNLRKVIISLADWPVLSAAALFTGRGRIAANLEQALASHTQIHIAEGNAVRDSITRGLEALQIAVVTQDRRDFSSQYQRSFSVDEHAALASLKTRLWTTTAAGAKKKNSARCWPFWRFTHRPQTDESAATRPHTATRVAAHPVKGLSEHLCG